MGIKSEDVAQVLQDAGVPNDKVQEAMLNLEKKEKPSIRLDKALPFPITNEEIKEATCEVCGRKRGEHSPLTFFVEDHHRLEVLQYLDLLERFLSGTESLELKLEYQPTDTLVSPKEMVADDKQFILEGKIAEFNVFDVERIYHTPYANLKEKAERILESLDSFVMFYESHSAFYVDELYFYKKRYEMLTETEAQKNGAETVDVPFEDLRAAYEEKARKDYEYLRSNLAKINQRIARLKEASEQFGKEEPYMDIIKWAEREQRKPPAQPTVRVVRPKERA